MIRTLIASALLCAVAGAPSAAPADAPVVLEDTVALVNGKPILLSDYRKEESTSLAFWRRTNPAVLADPAAVNRIREKALDDLITRELLIQAAKRAKLTVEERDLDDAVEEIKGRFREDEDTGRTRSDAEVERLFGEKLKADGVDFADFRRGLTGDVLARKVIDAKAAAEVPDPTDAETRAYFRRITAYIASGSTAAPAGMDAEDGSVLREAARQIQEACAESVRLSRILIRVAPDAPESQRSRALKTAQNLKKRIDGGEEFAKVAREASEDPETAPLGGDIGWGGRGAAPPELEKYAFTLPVGSVSEPIATDIGYNLLRADVKRAAEAPAFERFKGDLAKFLKGLRQSKAVAAYLSVLREKAVIERRLPAAP